MKVLLTSLSIFASLAILAACTPAVSSGGELTGIVWVLNSLNGSPLVAGTFISAEFTSDGKVSGSGSCNTYSGQYTVNGSQIQFVEPLASTMMACDPAVMDQESTYFEALAAAKTLSVQGDQLTLKDAGGSVLAAYTAQSQDLAGISWLVVGYNNGKQAVVSVIIDTELSADFGKDGNLSGSSGCNTYSGTYKVDGNKISIGPLASTMMFCNDPEGIMDQEAQYLAALQSAATYKLEGNRLNLRTADDAMAANFILK